MNDQIFYPAKGKMLNLGVFSSLLLIIGGGYSFFIKDSQSIFFLVLVIIGLFFLVLNLKPLLMGTKDGLYIDAYGITIKGSLATHFVEWENIKSFRSFDIMQQPMIAINLFNSDRFLNSKRGGFKKMGKMALKRNGTPISIAVNLFNVSKVELLSELNYLLEKYRN